jgi:Lrp/AsnC family transcriptional regulator for asnA, asnC and gidA
MEQNVYIDETDDKIIHILIEDARTSLKEIAKRCNISSVSVLNRVKRLKKLGVITGATLFTAINPLGFYIVATVGIQTDGDVEEILKFLKEHTYLIEPSLSMGEYDISALIYAENIASLNERVEAVRRRFGVRKVIINVWSGLPNMNFENIDLMPKREG